MKQAISSFEKYLDTSIPKGVIVTTARYLLAVVIIQKQPAKPPLYKALLSDKENPNQEEP